MTTVIYAVSILFAIIVVISEIIRNKRMYKFDINKEYKNLFLSNQKSPELYGIYLANKQGYSHKRTNKKWTKKN